MRKTDLTGMKVGKLTVVSKTDKKKNGYFLYHCKCDCGNEIDVESRSLTRKDRPTKSCGCLRGKNPNSRPAFEDLTGQKFGRLTVLEKVEPRDNDAHKVWKCQCDCGSIIYTRKQRLKEGQISCGCVKSKGEYKIASILRDNNIIFEKEKSFPDLPKLRFDFYFDNTVIEYDGKQHFIPNGSGWNTQEHFEQTHTNDLIKNEYCKKNNIKLIRIPYTELNNVNTLDDILAQEMTM